MKHNFDEIVNRKGTYCTQWDYIQDRFGEQDLLPFSISDTDFKIPEAITKKIVEVAKHEVYGYTRWNHHDFKDSITNYFERRFDCALQEDWLLYSPSVMYSVSLLIRLLSTEKDKVATFNPMYDAFFDVIQENHREIVSIDLIKENNTFSIDFQALEKELDTCKILLLCSPHNPTGRIWTKEELDKLVHLCKEKDVSIISDEIHMDIQLQGKHIPILKYYSNYENLYLVSSCSKTLNVPGLVGSYAIVPQVAIYEKFLKQTRKIDFLNSASIFGMYATMVGYHECDDYIDQLNAYIKENMKVVEEFIQKEMKDIRFNIPEATYLAWIDIRDVPFTSEQVQDALVHVGKVAIMKGETYGDNGRKYLRLNCGCPRTKLLEGLQRFKKAMQYLYEHEKRCH